LALWCNQFNLTRDYHTASDEAQFTMYMPAASHWHSFKIPPRPINICILIHIIAIISIYRSQSQLFHLPSEIIHVEHGPITEHLGIVGVFIDRCFRVPCWRLPCPPIIVVDVVQERPPQRIQRKDGGVAYNNQKGLGTCNADYIIYSLGFMNNISSISRTIEATGVGNETQRVLEVVFDELLTASNGGNYDDTTLLWGKVRSDNK